jgi:hypothetical protein
MTVRMSALPLPAIDSIAGREPQSDIVLRSRQPPEHD